MFKARQVSRAAHALCAVGLVALIGPAQAATCPALLDRSVPRLQDEQPQALCQYAGKVVLVVLGFPSNDFGGQEPGSATEIAAFCENQFAVKFPMFSKVTVKGDKAHPLYADLARRSGKSPLWNFHKYLVSRDGQTVRSYTSLTEPDDAALLRDVRAMLSAR